MTEEEVKEFAEMLKQTSIACDVLLLRMARDSLTFAKMDGMSMMCAFISQILTGERPWSEIKAIMEELKKSEQDTSSPLPNRDGNLN